MRECTRQVSAQTCNEVKILEMLSSLWKNSMVIICFVTITFCFTYIWVSEIIFLKTNIARYYILLKSCNFYRCNWVDRFKFDLNVFRIRRDHLIPDYVSSLEFNTELRSNEMKLYRLQQPHLLNEYHQVKRKNTS